MRRLFTVGVMFVLLLGAAFAAQPAIIALQGKLTTHPGGKYFTLSLPNVDGKV